MSTITNLFPPTPAPPIPKPTPKPAPKPALPPKPTPEPALEPAPTEKDETMADEDETFVDSKDNLTDIMALIDDAQKGLIVAVAEGQALLGSKSKRKLGTTPSNDVSTLAGGLSFPDGPGEGIDSAVFSSDDDHDDEAAAEPTQKKYRSITK
jgi:hypothetical protein